MNSLKFSIFYVPAAIFMRTLCLARQVAVATFGNRHSKAAGLAAPTAGKGRDLSDRSPLRVAAVINTIWLKEVGASWRTSDWCACCRLRKLAGECGRCITLQYGSRQKDCPVTDIRRADLGALIRHSRPAGLNRPAGDRRLCGIRLAIAPQRKPLLHPLYRFTECAACRF